MLKYFSLVLLFCCPAWGQTSTGSIELKPYNQVITAAFKTQVGLFKVHQLGDKFYYEIPKAELDRDFLLVTTVARGRRGSGDGGGESIGHMVVRWHRQQHRVLLEAYDYKLWAASDLPIAKAVAAANNPVIIASFNIETESEQQSPVFEVTRLFNSEIIELSPRYLLGAKAFDQSRSFVERITVFPENIEAESTLTLTNSDARAGFTSGEMRRGSASLRMHYSMVKLPEQPMKPRLYDSRVGYFVTAQTDYGLSRDHVKECYYLARWRLEKKEPALAVSEPVKPIVFYVDPATPSRWVPYIKAGVEQWQAAFEEAGFKNAIIAREAPKDPLWNIEDARYSVIRWVASTTPNAYGPHVSDPRSGEILEADIHIFHNVLDLVRRWYFIQVGHLDPQAQYLPLPDELMGRLLEFVVAHEVGHSLGLQHNMRSSSTYTLQQIRDAEWVHKMGHTPSIMDYARFNYVAQAADKIAVADLIPRIGPYDRFAIHWGYAPIPEATTPEAEKPTLDQWARQQDAIPWLRFSNLSSRGADPGDQTEAVGDENPVAATRLGLKNLKTTASMLLGATGQWGEDYSQLRLFYQALLAQWAIECNHVIPLVGGVRVQEKHFGQSGPIYTAIGKRAQEEAVKFVLSEVMVAQPWLLDSRVSGLLDLEGAWERVTFIQLRLLSNLCSGRRISRMAEQGVYTPREMLDTVRQGLFLELAQSKPVALPRRKLQRGFVDLLIELSNTEGESRSNGLRQMRILLQDLQTAQLRLKDPDTLSHIAQLQRDLRVELDPSSTQRRGRTHPEVWHYSDKDYGCWVDSAEDWVKIVR